MSADIDDTLLPGLPEMMRVTPADMLAEVDRELAARKKVYRNQINTGRMTPDKARRQYGRLVAVRRFLKASIDGGAVGEDTIPLKDTA